MPVSPTFRGQLLNSASQINLVNFRIAVSLFNFLYPEAESLFQCILIMDFLNSIKVYTDRF